MGSIKWEKVGNTWTTFHKDVRWWVWYNGLLHKWRITSDWHEHSFGLFDTADDARASLHEFKHAA